MPKSPHISTAAGSNRRPFTTFSVCLVRLAQTALHPSLLVPNTPQIIGNYFAISFTRRPIFFKNETHRNQNNDLNRTQCRLTNMKKNREHQSHECLQSNHSGLTLPHSQVHHPERLLIFDIVLMTTQHVTVSIKLQSSNTFPKQYAQMQPKKAEKKTSQQVILQQNPKWWLQFSC